MWSEMPIAGIVNTAKSIDLAPDGFAITEHPRYAKREATLMFPIVQLEYDGPELEGFLSASRHNRAA
jgi:hypothetical protein